MRAVFVVFGLWITAVVTGCLDAESRKAHYLEEGEKLLAEGDYERARIAFKNVLQIDRKDARAYYGMYRALEKLGRVQDSVAYLRAAVEEDPNFHEAKLKLARVYLAARMVEEGEKLVNEVRQSQPESVEAKVLSAMVALAKNDANAARQALQEALAQNPSDAEALRVQALIEWQEGNKEKALATLKQALAANPQNPDLQVTYVELSLAKGEPEEALQGLRQLIQQAPEQLSYRLRLAQILLGLGRPEEALTTLREGVTAAKDKKPAVRALLQLQGQVKGPEGVLAELDRLVQEYPDEAEWKLQKADGLVRLNRKEEAKTLLEKVIEQHPDSAAKAKVGLAELAWRSNDLAQSEKLLAEVLEKDPQDAMALALRARIALAVRKDADSAIADLRAALSTQPKNILLHQWLAQAHLHKGEFDLARETLSNAVEIAPDDPQLRIRLATVLWQQKQQDAALKALNQFLERRYDRQVASLAFRWQMDRSNHAEAQRLAELVSRNEPKQGIGDFFLGLVHLAKNEREPASAAFERALGKEPRALEPLEALVNLWLAENQPQKAVSRLQEVLAQYPDHYPAQHLLGEVLWRQNAKDRAVSAWKKAIEINPKWALPYWRLATAELEKGNMDGAIAQYQKALEADPDNEQRYLDLAVVLQRLGKIDQAIAVYEQALEKFPEALVFRNNLASVLLDRPLDEAALQRIEQLVKPLAAEERNPAYLDTVGWWHYRRKEYKEAADYLAKALAVGGEQPVLLYHQAKILWDSSQLEPACTSLNKALEKAPDLGKFQEVQALKQGCQSAQQNRQAESVNDDSKQARSELSR